MTFVDTNYFLRFLLKDVEKHYLEAKKLMFEALETKVKLFTSTIVFFELYWVLSSYYDMNKIKLLKILNQILDLEFIQLDERTLLRNSLELFTETNLSLEDCFNLNFARAKNAKDFKTFDIKLHKVFQKRLQ